MTVIPVATAVDLGCDKVGDGSRAAVVAPPAAAFGVNWAPDCVTINNGGAITWTQADAIPHGARIAGASGPCLDLGGMLAGQSNQVTFLFDEELGSLLILPLIRPGAVPPTLEDAVSECQSSAIQREGDTLVVAYDCRIHGALMPGTIKIDLAQ